MPKMHCYRLVLRDREKEQLGRQKLRANGSRFRKIEKVFCDLKAGVSRSYRHKVELAEKASGELRRILKRSLTFSNGGDCASKAVQVRVTYMLDGICMHFMGGEVANGSNAASIIVEKVESQKWTVLSPMISSFLRADRDAINN